MWCNRRHHYPIEKEWTFGKCVICYQEQHQEGQEKHHGTHKQQPSKLRVLDVSGHGLDVSGHGLDVSEYHGTHVRAHGRC